MVTLKVSIYLFKDLSKLHLIIYRQYKSKTLINYKLKIFKKNKFMKFSFFECVNSLKFFFSFRLHQNTIT